ncbi:hypothetical protein WR25_02344 isoform H [Diploscapter pachys]|uniref:Domain of unknown function DB domain-containing protein n=1 Tax=Diploscapter pachys TaxID=2018661 RepID=A0A2A2K105_9BILA|nr:hypothetical protein WR25_02344 isoform H [Diploscapter pachys]
MQYIHFIILLLFSIIFLPNFGHAEIPLAPYNVKVFCRQGRRFYRPSQTARECPSASTSCGYFEFPNKQIQDDSIGVYECVDNGIIAVEDADDDFIKEPIFAEMCGAIPKCQTIHIDKLNKSFLKYLITQHELHIEGITDSYVKFCCSLFHTTLQKLVQSGRDELSMPTPPPVICFNEVCDAGAVGCLLHTITSQEYDYDGISLSFRKLSKILFLDKKRRKRQYIEDDYVSPIELNFEDYNSNNDFQLVTRSPYVTFPPMTRKGKKQKIPPRKIYPNGNDPSGHAQWTFPLSTTKVVITTQSTVKTTLPSLKLPFYLPSGASEDDKNNDKALEALEDISHYEDETTTSEPKIETTKIAEAESTLTQKEDNALYVDIPLNNDALTTTTLPPQILPTDKNLKSFSEELKPTATSLPTTTASTSMHASKVYPASQKSEEMDADDLTEEYCVYRHLNDELYRYCLLVHQRKNGDRCYHHQGHIICCCFVPPDKTTCDPTEMDLVLPPPVNRWGANIPATTVVCKLLGLDSIKIDFSQH